MMLYKSFITGCAGPVLSDEEQSFMATQRPWGLILFARNIESPEQLRQLTGDFRRCVARHDAPVFIDQEGGRVRRLRAPHWPDYPAMGKLAGLWRSNPDQARRAVYLQSRLMGHDLQDLDITVNCLPVLDVRRREASDIVGDRALGEDPEVVSVLGMDVLAGCLDAGVIPVMKHVPGHGRALVDSHLELPRVSVDLETLEAWDFKPFERLKDCPMAMTAHIVFDAIDPERPVTQSATAISSIIRERLGFKGCLLSDDISMKALGGTLSSRVTTIVDAGCDFVLHCNGNLDEMVEVAASVPEVDELRQTRAEQALQWGRVVSVSDQQRADLRHELVDLIQRAEAVS